MPPRHDSLKCWAKGSWAVLWLMAVTREGFLLELLHEALLGLWCCSAKVCRMDPLGWEPVFQVLWMGEGLVLGRVCQWPGCPGSKLGAFTGAAGLTALHPHCACLGGCGCDKKQVGTSLLLAGLGELTAQRREQSLASLAELSSVLYLLTELITVT